jgi:IPT/TIG domain
MTRSWSWFVRGLSSRVAFAAVVVVAAALIAMPQAASAQGEPTVTGVSPSIGPNLGGTSVTITGTNFLDPDSLVVDFGSNGSPEYDVVSSTEITATSPENTSGGGEPLTVDVTVKTNYGTSATSSADHFTYSPNPTVAPDAASSVSQTSATLNGIVNPEGWDVTECEFEWGQVEAGGGVSYTDTPCAQTTPFTGTSALPVSLGLTGLSVDATYDYMVYVQYSCGAGVPACSTSGLGDSFTTLPNAPTVVTSAASGISQTQATLNGTVNPSGGAISTCQFQWGTTTKYGNTTACTQTVGSGTSPVAVSANLTGLSPKTTYHYRILATNPGGTSYGTDQTLSTQATPSPTVVTSPASAVSQTAATLNGTVNPNGGAISSCEFKWGATTNYGNTTACTQTVGSGTSPVAVSADLTGLSANTTYHYLILATNPGGTSDGTDQTFTTQPSSTVSGSGTGQAVTTQSGPPTLSVSPPAVYSSSGSAFSGAVNPDGSLTTAYFEYGLDPRYSGSAGPAVYTESTPVQTVGAGVTSVPISTSASGLVSNALYHVRLVATNAAGTAYGPDQTFTTLTDPPPPPPVLGKLVNVTPVSGLVLIKPPPGKSLGAAGDAAALSKGTGFVPLTEARQIPTGSEIDALQGSLKMVSNTGQVGKTQTATLTGGIFKLTQDRTGISKGVTDFTLQEGAFQGAPTYATCKAKTSADQATIASLSSKTLQLLKVSGHGKFKTTGRYASATVRGTIYTVADRCDGTLTHVIRDTVLVDDFVRHKTILLHAGQSYLAKKP